MGFLRGLRGFLLDIFTKGLTYIIYSSLSTMTSSLDEINASCLLPRLSISSTSASLLTMPDLLSTDQPLVSPVKKPIGAERTNNSARHSLISPNDIMQVGANDQQQNTSQVLTPPPVASTSAHEHPQRPSSTSCVARQATSLTESGPSSTNVSYLLAVIPWPTGKRYLSWYMVSRSILYDDY